MAAIQLTTCRGWENSRSISLKWQVGAVLTLSIALFFQIVKTNPQFELHTANAASGKDQPRQCHPAQ